MGGLGWKHSLWNNMLRNLSPKVLEYPSPSAKSEPPNRRAK